MTIHQVLYVLEVAKANSISQAAQRLYLSQSALSQQLRKLEEELGYAIFSRTAHGLTLTEDGSAFVREAGPVAETWKQFTAAIQRQQTPDKIRLRLGIGSRVYSNNLFSQVMDFFEANPQIEVTLVTEAGRDVMESLRRGELDLALDRLPVGEEEPDNSRFFFCPLIRERQCVLMKRDDPRAGMVGISFRELQDSTMMSGLEDSAEDRSMREICRKNHIKFSRVYRSDGIDTNMRLVRDGMGVAMGPESFADYFRVAAVPLVPETWVSLQFICLKSSLKRPEARQLRDYLLAICKQRETLAGGRT